MNVLVVIASALAGSAITLALLSRRESAQKRIFGAVKDRGYVQPWSTLQFAQRQVIKLYEELGELTRYLPTGNVELDHYAHMAYIIARRIFRSGETNVATYLERDKIMDEVSDVAVVLYCLASALNFDLESAAIDKAETDVERGVS